MTSYTVQNNLTGIGHEPKTLKDLGLDSADKAVRSSCDSSSDVTELLVEVAAQDDRSVLTDELDISFDAAGEVGEFTVPWGITLCTTVDQDQTDFCLDNGTD
ncbi:hypothetical protein C8K30_106368 [Promicromonospora sp. AC04]|uniref:hypothetical protein n=1 Tax=Promicromonospora sp. AC04 TaxID=2135723 RepID=UPI000D495A7F|nr:hypothetical protein [Promicromonospora sp. AC04]PUB26279.1 hypothetical protein C8K30_106368 [Promicromonospora sp. AC04]